MTDQAIHLLLIIGVMLALSGCCPMIPKAAYERAQVVCLDRYQGDADIDEGRDVACVDGVRRLREELER